MKTFLLKIIIFSLGLLVVLEVTARIFIPQQLIRYDPFYVADNSGLGKVPAANLDTIVNTGERDARLITDANRMRVGLDPILLTPDRRILMLGDSYMQAMQMDYEYTTDALLEHLLSDALQETVVIDNLSSATFDVNHYAIALEQQLAKDKYDLVLVFLNPSNDFIQQRYTYFEPQPGREIILRAPRSLSFREITDAVLYPMNDRLEQTSHLFVLFKSRLSLLLAHLGLTAYYFPPTLLTENANMPAWAVTAARLDEMNRLTDEHSTPILFVVIPMVTQIDKSQLDWYKEAFSLSDEAVDLLQPQRKLQEVSKQYGFVLADPYSFFVDAAQTGEQLYGAVDPHLAPEGHQRLATYLAPLILESLQRQQVKYSAPFTVREGTH